MCGDIVDALLDYSRENKDTINLIHIKTSLVVSVCFSFYFTYKYVAIGPFFRYHSLRVKYL